MTWTQQRDLVNSLSGRAQGKRREASLISGQLTDCMKSYLGSVEALVWSFAAGSLWAVGRSPVAENGAARASVMSAINKCLLVWQLVHRQLKPAKPAAGTSSEDQG